MLLLLLPDSGPHAAWLQHNSHERERPNWRWSGFPLRGSSSTADPSMTPLPRGPRMHGGDTGTQGRHVPTWADAGHGGPKVGSRTALFPALSRARLSPLVNVD